MRNQLALLIAASVSSVLAMSESGEACSGPVYGTYSAQYPQDEDQAVPTNVRPLFYADPPAALGLFDEDGNAVAFESQRIALTPDQFEVDTDEEGNAVFESTGGAIGVYQVRPAQALRPEHTYELIVVMAQLDLDAPVVLTAHPGQHAADGGVPDAGSGLRWPPELPTDDFSPTVHTLNFTTGSDADLQAPPPPAETWLAHGFFEWDRGESCVDQERICFGNVSPDSHLLATLLLQQAGQTSERTVLVDRDTTYMAGYSPDQELVSATLVALNRTGNTSDAVVLDRSDIPHNYVPTELDDGSLYYCDEPRPEGIWSSLGDAGVSPPDAPDAVDGSVPVADDGDIATDAAALDPTVEASVGDDPDRSEGDDAAASDEATDAAARDPNEQPSASEDDDRAAGGDAATPAEAADSGVARSDSTDGSSCSCRVGGDSRNPMAWLIMLVASLGVVVRRRVPR